jgi:hypothetical protein
MRSLTRLVAPVLAATAIVLAGSSSALAAASPNVIPIDQAWCFDDGSTDYCFDMDGQVVFLDNTAGSSVTITERVKTTVYEDGAYYGETFSTQLLRGVFGADGSVASQTVIHMRTSGGKEDCTYHLVLHLADYEAVTYHVSSTCGD